MSHQRSRGFSLLEVVVALLIVSITMGISVIAMGEYARRTAARRAAQVFTRDLVLARTAAVGERSTVSVFFDEAARSYEVRRTDGSVLLTRDFASGGEIPLSVIALETSGDSIAFSPRGILDFSGFAGSLAVARFEAGERVYFVSFNALGVAEVEGF